MDVLYHTLAQSVHYLVMIMKLAMYIRLSAALS